jgi:hypothetical protein
MTTGVKAKLTTLLLDTHRLISLWIFGDVAYAVLPIAVLALITLFLSAGFADFLLIKEWSFATIVMLGVTIRKFIRLKVEVQQTPRSYKLDGGVQAHILILIGAVLVLSLVILLEKGVLPSRHAEILGLGQLFLFGMAAISSFMGLWVEERDKDNASRLPDGIARGWLLDRLKRQLELAADSLSFVPFTAERAATIRFSEPINEARVRQLVAAEMAHVLAELERVEGLVATARKAIDSIGTAVRVRLPDRPSDAQQ